MIKKTSLLTCLCIFLFLLTKVSIAGDGHYHNHDRDAMKADNPLSEVYDSYKNKNSGMEADSKFILVKLNGTAPGYLRSVPGFDEEALCFDIDLLDLKSGEIIGGATDCISDEQMNADGVEFVGTTYLYLPGGNVSVRSVADENIMLRTGQKITNITGSATTGNTFIEGESTGIYENSTGNTRISGMINTENFAFNVGDEQFFDCIFEIQLD